MTPKLAKYDECTGCSACAATCQHHALKMEYDKNGHLMPVLQKECIGCGLCTNICPILNDSTIFHPVYEMKTYTAWSNNDALCFSATSGGVFSQLAIDTLKKYKLGVVIGAELTDHNTCKHIGIENSEQLSKIVGTKYIQSDASDAFKLCRKALIEGKHCLFCGTPCQIAGLYSYLRKTNTEKLVTIDLVCHGVPSKLATDISTEYYGADHILSYRSKVNGWHRGFDCEYQGGTGIIRGDFFFKNFGGTDRPSCYHCKYARIERTSDITLGDQWGLRDHYPERKQLGANLVLCNTSKGVRHLTENTNISCHQNPLGTLDAPSLFMPITTGACSVSKFLYLIKRCPNTIKYAIVSMDWHKGWYLIPFILWRRFVVWRYRRAFAKKLLVVRKNNHWL